MKKVVALAVLLGLVFSIFSACSVRVEVKNGIEHVFIVSSAENYRRDEKIPATPESKLTASLAKREAESMQFILNFPTDKTGVKVYISDLVHENGKDRIENVSLYKEHYLNCDAAYDGKTPPGFYPDALIPIDKDLQINNSVDIKKNENQGYWITVKTSPIQTPGLYKGLVTVDLQDGKPVKFPVEVEVWNFELPQKPSFETAFAYWSVPLHDYLKQKASPDVLSKIDFDKLDREIYEWFFDYRLCSGHLPVYAEGGPVNLAKAQIEYFNTHPEVACFEIYPSSREYLDTLEAGGVLPYCYTYLFDEPQNKVSVNLEISERYKAVHALNPHVRNMLTTAPREAISDCDVWCPIWDSYGCDKFVIDDALKRGDELWWYGCAGPRAPYPTYHLMDSVMSARLVSWMQKAYNVSGNLYWTTTDYWAFDLENEVYLSETRDIWTDPYVFKNADGSTSPLGVAGDGQLIYMGFENDGYVNKTIPVPTLRLENIRDGNEDFEYLVILENKVKALLEKWKITDMTASDCLETYFNTLFASLCDFDRNPEEMLKARKRVAYDILNLESLVTVSSAPSPDVLNRRTVSVFAENGSSVKIDGKTVEGKTMGAYSLYESSFDMSIIPDGTEITVTVNGKNYERTLRPISDSEYMNAAKAHVQADAEALGLENSSYVRDIYSKNNFHTFFAPSIGVYDRLLYSENRELSEVISLSEKERNDIILAIAGNLQNEIPVALLDEAEAPDNPSREKLSIYVPQGAEVKVNGKSVPLSRNTETAALYETTVETGTAIRYKYTLTVTYKGKTETTAAFLLNEVEAMYPLLDFSQPDFEKVLSSVPKNKGIAYEIIDYEGEKALKVTLNDFTEELLLPGSLFIKNNLNDCDQLCMELVNPLDKNVNGMYGVLSTGQDRVNFSFGSCAPKSDDLYVSVIPSVRISKVKSFTLSLFNTTVGFEPGKETYIIKGLYGVRLKTPEK